jgi:hypothetical protein
MDISATEKTVTVDVRCGIIKKSKVEICHKGKNNLWNENAVASHLAHGDTLGNCSPQIDEK